MTNILFITSTRIGDAILSTGLLDYCLNHYPNPRFTIVCGGLPSSLFEGVPNLDELIPLKKQSYHRHWFYLWKRIESKKFDVVIDLRDSIISHIIRGSETYRFGRHIDKTKHKVLQNAEVMNLKTIPAPRLFLTEAQTLFANKLIQNNDQKIIAVAPTANWIGKTWPSDRFIEVIKDLIKVGGIFENARVAVFAAPNEEEEAYTVLNAIPIAQQINVIAKGNPAEAAACLALCDFFIGNDSGLMHTAAAAGVKTFGLFGASYASIYAPYGEHTAFAHTPETFDELKNFEGYDPKTLQHSLMTSLQTETVISAIEIFLNNKI